MNKVLIALFIFFVIFLRLFRLDYPNAYVFDEVYHGFTAKEYLKGSKEAWEWWTTPPPGVAFEWTHPPLAKELMTVSMFTVRSTDAWAWRLPGALLGLLSVFMIYKLGTFLFKNQTVGIISAFLFSIDGLNFVQSRTGMNDIYLVTFSLISIYFLLHKKFFLTSLFLGLALASKWSGLYLLGLEGILILYFLFKKKITLKEFIKTGVYLIITPIIIYLASYIPFFLLGHTVDQFMELQRQMWWYHSNLKATHDYSSPAWSWPLNLYPVWYYVQYHENTQISNIFASGNPLLFWVGSGAILVTVWDFIRSYTKKTLHLFKADSGETEHKVINLKEFDSFFIILMGFFVFWLPWLFSPRIMFLYHFSPSIPFLSLSLGYQLSSILSQPKNKSLGITILGLILLSFLLTYPMITGIPLPRDVLDAFFDFNLTKNPFK